MANALFANLDRVHVSEPVARRIRQNLGLEVDDVAAWCRRQIGNPDTLTRSGGRFHVRGDGFVLSIDEGSFAVVTARRERPKKGSDMADVGIIRSLDDIPAMKRRLIEVFDAKTHRAISKYGLLLADHVLQLARIPMDAELQACYDVNRRWQDGDAHFQQARDMADVMHCRARAENNPIARTALRCMGQVAATPHVKRHALIASDYAVKLVNLLHPGDLDSVRRERALQIRLMRSV